MQDEMLSQLVDEMLGIETNKLTPTKEGVRETGQYIRRKSIRRGLRKNKRRRGF